MRATTFAGSPLRASRATTKVFDPVALTGKTVVGLLLGFFALFFAIPIVWLVIATTKSPHQLQVDPPFTPGSWGSLVANWRELIHFQGDAIAAWLGNTALYTFSALAIVLVVSIPAGYALALTSFHLRRLLLVTTLVVMLVPNTALVLPIFLELNKVGLIGKALSVILPFSFFPFGVYLTYIYFSTSMPRDLLAAARIDGCSEVGIFTKIALPLATPVVALVAFFSFVANWNNYFLPFVMLPSSKEYPLQIGLSDMLGGYVGSPTLALATLMSVVPVLLVFLFSQHFLIAGMTAGSTIA